jgi:hypothetical protein
VNPTTTIDTTWRRCRRNERRAITAATTAVRRATPRKRKVSQTSVTVGSTSVTVDEASKMTKMSVAANRGVSPIKLLFFVVHAAAK